MGPDSQTLRSDQKLEVITRSVAALRRRINSLAIQTGVFVALAAMIAAVGAIYAAALLLSPITFGAIACTVAIAAVFAVWSGIRRGWRMRAGAPRAANIADERAGLKERLSTIVSASHSARRSPLWEYLIEDTIGRAEEFDARRIEKRRVSRTVYALAASIAVVAFAVPLARIAAKRAPIVAAPVNDDLTFDLDDLQLRPAGPGDGDDALSVTADPETMRRLQERMAREGLDADGNANASALDRLLDRARGMAGNLQGRLTGRPSDDRKLTLKLSGGASRDAGANRDRPALRHHRNREVAGQFKSDRSGSKDLDRLPSDRRDIPNNYAQSSGGAEAAAAAEGSNPLKKSTPDEQSTDSGDSDGSDLAGNGGAMHGIGADPDSLFGASADAKLGTEGFEISIEARPMEHGAHDEGHGYEPPRVRTPLSPVQQPDEAIARMNVPPNDRATIRKVYER
jgi:hypothetical protein